VASSSRVVDPQSVVLMHCANWIDPVAEPVLPPLLDPEPPPLLDPELLPLLDPELLPLLDPELPPLLDPELPPLLDPELPPLLELVPSGEPPSLSPRRTTLPPQPPAIEVSPQDRAATMSAAFALFMMPILLDVAPARYADLYSSISRLTGSGLR
jgi:hypothetical protein